jgi:hypothetical protein
MDEKKSKRSFFMFETNPEDQANIVQLAKMFRLTKSAAVRSVISLAVKGLREGEEKNHGTSNR